LSDFGGGGIGSERDETSEGSGSEKDETRKGKKGFYKR
jgi:hypothetical protein